MRSVSPKRIALAVCLNVLRPAMWRILTRRRLACLNNEALLRKIGWKDKPQNFLSRLNENARLRFFFHPRNRKDFFLNLLATSQPADSILDEADTVLRNEFQALGSPLVSLGDPIPWHRDFKSGKEWPTLPPHRLDMFNPGDSADVKVPWELSRFHQVWWLGKASWMTGNRAYAAKFESLVTDWIDKNPVGIGINWSNAKEASIRACNWIAGYYFFCEDPSLPGTFWMRLFRSLITHGLFIESHLDYSHENGSSYLSGVVGLIFLGVLFQESPLGKRWISWGVSQLQCEIEEQVFEDGVSHEQSTAYHGFVLELFYSAALLCRKNNIRLRASFWAKLERMFEVVQSYSRPDGTIPLIGDADDGRLFRIAMQQRGNDHRHALSVGAILFERSDFKHSAGRFDQEALWYFGGEGFERHQLLKEAPQAPTRASFRKAGIFVLQNIDTHILIDAGGIGRHGHNDTLSFEFWHNVPFIVDSGTYAFSADAKTRKFLQGTAAHNTVMVDDIEIADWKNLWTVREDRTKPQVLEWGSTHDLDTFEAEHYAYTRLAHPVVHRRKLVFNKGDRELRLIDTLSGAGGHTIQLRLHFHPDVFLEKKEKNSYLATSGTERIRIVCSEQAEIVETLFSPSYGILMPSKGLQVRLHAALPHVITTRITLT